MIIERAVDTGAMYEHLRQHLLELVRSLTPSQRRTTVPATPAWTVVDVVAHVVGITVDLNAGQLGSDLGPDAWTAAQVERRRGRSIDELAAEWDHEAPTFEEGLRLFGYEVGSHFVADLLQHVADVDQALGRPRLSDDDETLAVALDFYLDSFHETLVVAGLGVTFVIADDEPWKLGTGPPIATVTAGRFDAFRALGGRRSGSQLRAMAWSGDVDAVIGLVSRYGLPTADLLEA